MSDRNNPLERLRAMRRRRATPEEPASYRSDDTQPISTYEQRRSGGNRKLALGVGAGIIVGGLVIAGVPALARSLDSTPTTRTAADVTTARTDTSSSGSASGDPSESSSDAPSDGASAEPSDGSDPASGAADCPEPPQGAPSPPASGERPTPPAAPKAGEKPKAPKAGEKPKAGEAPKPPKAGDAPKPPKAGDAPKPPKAGEAPEPPKAGDAPKPPKAGDRPGPACGPAAQADEENDS